jgi:hypothetical protein
MARGRSEFCGCATRGHRRGQTKSSVCPGDDWRFGRLADVTGIRLVAAAQMGDSDGSKGSGNSGDSLLNLIWSRSSSFVTPALEALLPGTRDTPADPSGETRSQLRSAMALPTPGPGPCPGAPREAGASRARVAKLELRDQRRRRQSAASGPQISTPAVLRRGQPRGWPRAVRETRDRETGGEKPGADRGFPGPDGDRHRRGRGDNMRLVSLRQGSRGKPGADHGSPGPDGDRHRRGRGAGSGAAPCHLRHTGPGPWPADRAPPAPPRF